MNHVNNRIPESRLIQTIQTVLSQKSGVSTKDIHANHALGNKALFLCGEFGVTATTLAEEFGIQPATVQVRQNDVKLSRERHREISEDLDDLKAEIMADLARNPPSQDSTDPTIDVQGNSTPVSAPLPVKPAVRKTRVSETKKGSTGDVSELVLLASENHFSLDRANLLKIVDVQRRAAIIEAMRFFKVPAGRITKVTGISNLGYYEKRKTTSSEHDATEVEKAVMKMSEGAFEASAPTATEPMKKRLRVDQGASRVASVRQDGEDQTMAVERSVDCGSVAREVFAIMCPSDILYCPDAGAEVLALARDAAVYVSQSRGASPELLSKVFNLDLERVYSAIGKFCVLLGRDPVLRKKMKTLL